jgi:hypothetical protein
MSGNIDIAYLWGYAERAHDRTSAATGGLLEFGIRYERRGCGEIICSCLVRDAHDSLQFFAVVSLFVCLARLYCS